MNSIPQKLKRARLRCDLKQKDVAKRMGLKNEDRISRWETGKSVPSLKNLLKLCEIYEVKVCEICTNI